MTHHADFHDREELRALEHPKPLTIMEVVHGRESPPADVLEAFGLRGPVTPLPGGQGRSWRCDDAVLKPVDDPAFETWAADLFARLPEDGFRLPRPRQARGGGWQHGGWSAYGWLEGQRGDGRHDEVLAVGDRLHGVLAGEPRPGFLDARDDAWWHGDRLAWGDEGPVGDPPTRAMVERLLAVRSPVDLAAQLVHGDLEGNVLFAPGLAPAVIDLAPYWRPADWAAAVVVVDAMTWGGAGRQLALRAARGPAWPQLLVRAELFRLGTRACNEARRTATGSSADYADLHRPTVEVIERLVSAGT